MSKQEIIFILAAIMAIAFFITAFMLFNDPVQCPEGMVYVPRLGVCIEGAKPL
jgi:hypothetical protein